MLALIADVEIEPVVVHQILEGRLVPDVALRRVLDDDVRQVLLRLLAYICRPLKSGLVQDSCHGLLLWVRRRACL